MAGPLDETLTAPAEDAALSDRYGNALAEYQAPAVPTTQQAKVNRYKAEDLAARGIPSYKTASGDVAPVTDEGGTPLSGYDPTHDIAYDKSGTPKQISYGVTGPPVLKDPFADLPQRTDQKTGDIEQAGKGLYNWVGQDPVIAAAVAQKEKDKAIKTEAGLLGQKVSLDHADMVAGRVELKNLRESVTDPIAGVPELQDPKFKDAPQAKVMEAVSKHFDEQYATPEANAKTPEGVALRASIDARKAKVTGDVQSLYDTGERVNELSDSVEQGRGSVRDHIDTLLAHGRGELGPLDAPPTVEEAARLYPPEKDWGRMLGDARKEPVDYNNIPKGQATKPGTPDITGHQATDAAVAEAKAGNKNYGIGEQGEPIWKAGSYYAGLYAATQDGIVNPKWAEANRAAFKDVDDKYNAVQDAAGSAQVAKAILLGAGRGGIFLAAAGPGAAYGGAALSETGPIGATIGAALGGLTTGTIALFAANKGLEKLAEYNDAVKSLVTSAELHPVAAAAGELTAFAASAPRALTNLYRLATVAGTAVDDLGPAAVRLAQAKAVGKQLGITGLTGAGMVPIRMGFDAARYAAADALGIKHDDFQNPTMGEALTFAALGMLTGAHNITFKDYKAGEIASIFFRAKIRNDAGIDLGAKTAPGDITKAAEAKGMKFDSTQAQYVEQPLSAQEQAVYNALKEKAARMQASGAFDDATGVKFTATQANVASIPGKEGAPIVSAGVEPIKRKGAPPPEAKGGAPEAPKPPSGGSPKEPEGPRPGSEQAPPSPEHPVTAEVKKDLIAGNISHAEATVKLVKAGLNDDDIARAIGPPPKPGEKPVAPPAPVEPVKPAAGLEAAEKAFLERGGHADKLEAQQKLAALQKAFPDPTERIAQIEKHLGASSTAPTIDEAAHEAATSPKNGLAEPTQPQKEAGNYQKGHVLVGGLDISIENPAGSRRQPQWPALKSHYGYIKGTVGADKDHVDIFIKTGTPLDYSGPVFVVNQHNKAGGFDEHKAVMGVATAAEAKAEYLSNYGKGWTGAKSIAEFANPTEFKSWASKGAKGQPAKSFKASDFTPALLSEGKVIPGELGKTHKEIYAAAEDPRGLRASDPEHGFITKGNRFHTRADTSAFLGHRSTELQAEELADMQKEEKQNATTTGEQQGGQTGELPRVPPREDVSTDTTKVREGESPETDAGGGAIKRGETPTEQPGVRQPEKAPTLKDRQTALTARLEALKDIPTATRLALQTLLRSKGEATLASVEKQIAKLEEKAQAVADAKAKAGTDLDQSPASGAPASVTEESAREAIAAWQKGAEDQLKSLGVSVVEAVGPPTGGSGLSYATGEISFHLADMLAEVKIGDQIGVDGKELIGLRLAEELAHAIDHKATGDDFLGKPQLILWGSIANEAKFALRDALSANPAVANNVSENMAAEYMARLYMHRHGMAVPESLWINDTYIGPLLAALDAAQSPQVEAHLQKMEDALAGKSELDAAMDDLMAGLPGGTKTPETGTKPPKTGTKPPTGGTKPPKTGTKPPKPKPRVTTTEVSAAEQKIIDDATKGLFATPMTRLFSTPQLSVEVERVPKFRALAKMMLAKNVDTPEKAADFLRTAVGHQMLPYAQAVWDAISLFKPELYGTHDWDRLFAGTASPEPKKAEPELPIEKIEDFGEKIGGARKDKWAERGLRGSDLDEMTDIEKEAYTTRDNIWKTPDYEKLVADGMPKAIAYLVKEARAGISKTPRLDSYYARGVPKLDLLKRYIETIGKLRDGLQAARTPQDMKDAYNSVFTRNEGGGWSDVGRGLFDLVARKHGDLNGKMQPSSYGSYELARVERLLKDNPWPTPQALWQKQFKITPVPAGQKIWSAEKGNAVTEAGFIVTRSYGGGVLHEAKTGEEAEAWAKSQVTTITGPRLSRPFKEDAERKGPDYREGKNVTGEQILETFGFRGGEFGNWTNQSDRQQSLNQAYDGLKDLARVLRLPDAAISLNGELGIAFGARGSGKAAAHYEPTKVVINLTKTQGSGSLAHEWAHAVDDYFGKQATKSAAGFASHGGLGGAIAKGVFRPETAEAWAKAMKAITEKIADQKLVIEEVQAKLDRSRGNLDSWLGSKRTTQIAAAGIEKEKLLNSLMMQLRMEEPREGSVDALIRQLADLIKSVPGVERLDSKSATAMSGSAYWAERHYKGVERAIAGEVARMDPTQFYANALKKEKGDKDGYWARLHEMFARALESYAQRKVEAEGNSSDYLVHSTRGETTDWGSLYPSGQEAKDIDAAFDHLWGTIKTEKGEKGTRLYATPATDQLPIPEDKFDAFDAVARKLIASGVTTPKALSDYMEGRYQEKMRPYYQALWTAMGMVDNTLRSKPDWAAIRQLAVEPEPKKETKSWAAEMNTYEDADDVYTGNGMRFPTKLAAEKYADDLMSRWMSVVKWRVVESTDEPNRDMSGNFIGDMSGNPIPPATSPHAQVAEYVMAKIASNTKFTGYELFEAADRAFGGTQGQGKYTPKDAYDAMELGVNKWILEKQIKPEGSVSEAVEAVKRLEALIELLPTQTKRTEEMQKFQQFSTPPPFAFVANWVANINPDDVMVETSAGIGGLAVFAKNAGATVHVNELADRRAVILRELFDNVTELDATHWHALAPQVKATVGVINPPFSATGGRTAHNDSMNGAKQLESLLASLEPGGRLVAITGEGMGAVRPAFLSWWKGIAAKYDVLANVGLEGEAYRKYGTTFGNQLIIIDKPLAGQAPKSYNPITKDSATYADLIPLLEPVRNARHLLSETGSGSGATEPEGGGTTPAGGADTGTAPGPTVPPTGVVGPGPTGPGGLVRPPRGSGGGKGSTGGAVTGTKPKTGAGEVSGGGARPGGELAGPEGSGGITPGAADSGVQPGELGVTEAAALDAAMDELTDAIFVPWVSNVTIKGAQPHPTPLVESASMASVQMPPATYKPKLSQEVIDAGELSDAQIVPIIYAGQAHEKILPDGVTRQGYFIGDGTGVGKGRIIAGVMADNRARGRERGIWISEKKELMEDAKRDMSAVGDAEVPMINLGKIKGKTGTIKLKKGVLFATYDTMKGDNALNSIPPEYRPSAVVQVRSQNQNGTVIKSAMRSGQVVMTVKTPDGVIPNLKPRDVSPVTPATGQKSRLDQIVEWLGVDFDGPIMFDEAHNASNSINVGGGRGGKAPSQKALAVVDLQTRLPNARIVYVSATGATEVSNLAYADRLGIWGNGAFFTSKADFINKISAAGLSAMEIIARDLKTLGLMNARTLSFGPINPDDPADKGVEFGILQHNVDGPQRAIYDELARGWQMVFKNMNAALEQTGGAKSGTARGRARGAYFSAAQRFFNQTLTAMQMPSILKDMHTRLDAGEAAVLQLVNTNEATLERELQSAEAEETELEDIDTTPKKLLQQYIENSFPTSLFQPVTDQNGNEAWVLVVGADGKPVQDPVAVAMKNALLDKVATLPVPENPLEQILAEFGTENVAEITGRKRRIVKGPEGKPIVEERTDSVRAKEAKDFNDDKRRILIFSGKGGTGFSYHSDKGFINQRRRWHYLVQAGWRADKAIQGLGRAHRSNEANAPMIQLARTDLDAHKRFISTIARRLSQLGAMTAGERRSTGQGLFTEADNLENEYSQRALNNIIEESKAGTPGALPWELITDKLGMDNLIDEATGNLRQTAMPKVPQFLNRLLALEFDEGNMVFGRFFDKMRAAIEQAQENGSYDPGLQILDPGKGGTITKKSDDVVYTHPESGDTTRLVEVEVASPAKFNHWGDIIARYKGEPEKVIENKRTGSLFAIYKAGNLTDRASGRVVPGVYKMGIKHTEIVPQTDVASGRPDDKFETISQDKAQELWTKQIAEADPTHREKKTFIVGLFLPIWNRLNFDKVRVFKFKTTTAPATADFSGYKPENILGILIPPRQVANVRIKLGAGVSKKTPAEVAKAVLEDGTSFTLANGWRIHRSRIMGELRIEVRGLLPADSDEFTNFIGGFVERIQFKPRYFIPTTGSVGPITRILQKAPITSEGPGSVLSSTGVREFYKKDVHGNAVAAKAGIVELLKATVHLVSPTTGVAEATVDRVMEMIGNDRNQVGYETDRALVAMEKAFQKAPRDEQIAFVDRYKTGEDQPNPELQALDKMMREIDLHSWDAATAAYEALGYPAGKVPIAWKDNHFRVMWKIIPGSDEAKGRKGLGVRPWRGSQGMRRMSTLDDMSEGVEAGGVPFSWNPVTNFKQAQADIWKLTSTLKAWKWAKDMGLAQFAKGIHPKPPTGGFGPLDDPIAKVYFPSSSGEGMITAGQWFVEPGFGRLINNYLSQDLVRSSKFGRGLMWTKNATTALELALSPFHAVFETLEAVGSNVGLGLEMLVNRGVLGGSAKATLEGLRTMATALLTPLTHGLGPNSLGAQIRRAAGDPGSFFASPDGIKMLKAYPDARAMIDDLFAGGWKPTELEQDWRTNSVKAFTDAVADIKSGESENYIGAGLRAFPAANEMLMRPIFDYYIPNLKVAQFFKEYAEALRQRDLKYPDGYYIDRSGKRWEAPTRSHLARQIWRFVEDRFGELNYDTLFWNRTFKSAMQLMFRSVTWKLGSVEAFGGAAAGQAKEFYDAVRERRAPELHRNMAWLFGMLLLTASLGLIMSKVLGHHDPESLTDLIFPRADPKDERVRVSLPTYWKDLVHLWHSPSNYVISSMSGWIGKIADILRNKDYFGMQIRDTEDPLIRQAFAVGKYTTSSLLPFSIRGYKNLAASDVGALRKSLALIGVNPAPKYIGQSDAEQASSKYWQGQQTEAGLRPEQMETKSDKRALVATIRHGGQPDISGALAKGTIKARDVKALYQRAAMGQLASQVQHMPLWEAERIYAKATPKEKAELAGVMATKRGNSYKRGHRAFSGF